MADDCRRKITVFICKIQSILVPPRFRLVPPHFVCTGDGTGLVIGQGQHYDYKTRVITNARKTLPYRSMMFAAKITDLKTPYIVYLKYIQYFSAEQKRLNLVNFRLCFIKTTVAIIFF